MESPKSEDSSERDYITATEIVDRLQKAGDEACFVGGCVRNRLLGLTPKDIDIATSARPEKIQQLFPGSDLIGARFGVVMVGHKGRPFEVTTFRKDGRYTDHRRPESVTFGSLEEDARRRDFTINALYYDPLSDRLIDPVGGCADLNARLLRCIGDPIQRFEEDALRLLRAVRFTCRFGLQMEAETWSALRKKHELIASISAERIRDEIILIFTGPHRGMALEMLSESGLLAVILPEVEAMKGVEQPAQFHPEGDVFVHTRLAIEALPDDPDATLALATLRHDVGKPPTFRMGERRIRFDGHDREGARLADAVCQRLRCSNKMREEIVNLISRHMTFLNIPYMKPSTVRRFLASPTIQNDLALHKADVMSSGKNLEYWNFCKNKLDEMSKTQEAMIPQPLLNGDDLIAAGLKPGPDFHGLLTAVADQQMEGNLADKAQALEWVMNHCDHVA